MKRTKNILLGAIALTGMTMAQPAHATVTFVGYAAISGQQTDFSGLNTLLEDGSRSNGLDGFGSGIAYSGFENRYLLLSDRGPNKTPYNAAVDNTTSYATRFQTFDITLTPTADPNKFTVQATNVATTLFKNETGQKFTGISSAFTSNVAAQNLRFDPESVRVAPDGSIWTSDEYGPNLYHFDQNGNRIGYITLPAKFQIANLNAIGTTGPTNETNSNTTGRVTNKGAEGLAITPDGKHLLVALQSNLIQDGPGQGANVDKGRNVRLLYYEIDAAGNPVGSPKEILYRLQPGANNGLTGTAISDIVAINDHEFLVDERDSAVDGVKRLYKIDINGATDISGIPSLSAYDTDANFAASGITAVSKDTSPLLDFSTSVQPLLDLAAGIPGYKLGVPDKIEGYAFGPNLPDGRHLLLATNDNDFLPPSLLTANSFPNYIFAFAVSEQDLAGSRYVAQQFQANETFPPTPEPITVGMTLFSLAALGMAASRRRAR
ncbi:MAG: esterase-like activity of phytase family protein [Planctomycetes bacterium]|nr:esterase-like activity of phytase family protein [Planctomycetota bacterium]